MAYEEAQAAVAAAQLATALGALAERCFHRCLFPAEVRAAFAALDAYRMRVVHDEQ